MVNRVPELLSPAGSPEKLRYAVMYGADAVYCALKDFGMRAKAENFTVPEFTDAVKFAHAHGVKVYLALNTMPREPDLAALPETLDSVAGSVPDAFIVADAGVLSAVKARYPDVPVHLSTQACVTNSASCRFWYDAGVSRIVLARELSLEDIRSIRNKVPDSLELEVFVHGSMCVAYSGRCLLSAYLTGRSANEGLCTQPCRYKYHVTEDTRPDLPMDLDEDGEGAYLFSSRDLCMVEHLSELMDAGIDSLKIEGRMKSLYYTAVTAAAYRRALTDAAAGRPFDRECMELLTSVSHREYDTGFFYGSPMSNANICEANGYISERAFIATVEQERESGMCLCRQRNKAVRGERVAVISRNGTIRRTCLNELFDEDMVPIASVPHPQMLFFTRLPGLGAGDIIVGEV